MISLRLGGCIMPEMFGEYELYEEVGRGAAATVYRSLDTHTGQIVALKILNSDDIDDPARLQQRLAVEARIANQLDHKNIVRVYEHGRVDDRLYIAMEYVNGETLKTRLRRETRLSEAEAHRIALEIAHALDAAYQHSVVHGDIKPANVLLSKTGEVKVGDFGIARAIGLPARARRTVTGTPAYMAPELWDRTDDSIRTDLFALGAVLHEMLTGNAPFGGGTEDVIRQQARNDAFDVQALREASAKLAPVVERLLRKKPGDRYPTPTALAQALEGITNLETTTVTLTAPQIPPHAPAPGSRSSLTRFTSRYQLPIAGVVALVGIGIGILGITGGFSQQDSTEGSEAAVALPEGAVQFSTGSALSEPWQVYLPKREPDGSIAREVPTDLEPGEVVEPEFLYPVIDRPLGEAQVVCLSSDVPANCPPEAVNYGRGKDGGWEIPDEIRRDAHWVWAPRVSPEDPADDEAYIFKTSVKADRKTRRVSLAITADNKADVFIAGEYWFSTTGPNTVTFFNIHSAVNEYLNEDVEIMVLAQNEGYSEGNCDEAPCTYRRNPAAFVVQGPREWIWDTEPDRTD